VSAAETAGELLAEAERNVAAAVKGIRSVQDRAAVATAQSGIAQTLMLQDHLERQWAEQVRVAQQGRAWVLDRMRAAYEAGVLGRDQQIAGDVPWQERLEVDVTRLLEEGLQ
jgi:hypothetical protein